MKKARLRGEVEICERHREEKRKKNNLERQALEERRAKSRCGREPKEDSPDKDDENDDDDDDDDDDSEGMAACLDRVLQGLPQPADRRLFVARGGFQGAGRRAPRRAPK